MWHMQNSLVLALVGLESQYTKSGEGNQEMIALNFLEPMNDVMSQIQKLLKTHQLDKLEDNIPRH